MTRLLLAATAVVLAACTYRPGGIGDPLQRKFQYFSYLGGDDIRAGCMPGSLARYRFVYNAIYDEQVRAYDLRQSATGEGAVLFTHVFNGGPLIGAELTDPFAHSMGASADIRLSEAEYQALIRAVEASGFGEPTPSGLRLHSATFHWLVSACADGRFHFNAWLYPSERFDRIQFDRLLFGHDNTGVPINRPRDINLAEKRLRPNITDEPNSDFELMVGRNGLFGIAAVF